VRRIATRVRLGGYLRRRAGDPRRRRRGTIIEVQLSDAERAAFQKSVDAVKGLVATMAKLAPS